MAHCRPACRKSLIRLRHQLQSVATQDVALRIADVYAQVEVRSAAHPDACGDPGCRRVPDSTRGTADEIKDRTAGRDAHPGLSTLADRYGFIVIYPSVTRSSKCWDVSSAQALRRDGGSNQQWNLNTDGTVTGVQSGLCLTPNAGREPDTVTGRARVASRCSGPDSEQRDATRRPGLAPTVGIRAAQVWAAAQRCALGSRADRLSSYDCPGCRDALESRWPFMPRPRGARVARWWSRAVSRRPRATRPTPRSSLVTPRANGDSSVTATRGRSSIDDCPSR